MKRVLVTGGCGFIGSNIVRALLAEGYSVRVLENLATGRKENLEGAAEEVDLIEGPEGILSPELCARAVKGVDAILHQAALPSVPRSIANPALTDRVNVKGTLTLLEAARHEGVRRFVFASSSSIYGDAPGEIRTEDIGPQPLSPYAVSKRAAEVYVNLYHRLFGLETVVLRYFNVFGPRQDPNSQYAAVVPIFTRHMLARKKSTIYGDGEQSRDFTFVENVVSGNLLALEAEGVAGEVFNLATSENHSVNDLFRLIRDFAGGNGVEPVYAPSRKGDVRRSLADISKAERMLGYKVLVPFEEGIRRTVTWYREIAAGEDGSGAPGGRRR
ncbi:MAG: SDR family oxidoreductase [bacterium]